MAESETEINRVCEENLRALCESMAFFTGYDFDDWDWQAIETALPSTDADRADGWYDYPLSGRVPLTLLVAVNPGSSVVDVRVAGGMDDRLSAQLDVLFHVFNRYRVR
jgi:hypothetical protein